MNSSSVKTQKFAFQILGTSFDIGVAELTVDERLSTPYRADLVLVCEEVISFDEAIGKEGLITIASDQNDRVIHGIINRFSQTGRRGRFIIYEAQLVPQIWLMSQKQDSRIYQNQGVSDLVSELLGDDQIPPDRKVFRLQNTYAAKDYSVQYQESDLAFMSRLLENEGIWYFFEHSRSRHVIVFADSRTAYKPFAERSELPFKNAEGMAPQEEVVHQFGLSKMIGPNQVTQTDFNYNSPSVPLMTQEGTRKSRGLEVFVYPGGYEDASTGKHLTKVRLQEMQSLQETGGGQSTCAALTPGTTFTLKDHPTTAFNRSYLVIAVKHRGAQPQVFEENSSPSALSYSNEFTVIPAEATVRPARITPVPIIQGPQTAVVVGPAGEEIYTDGQGRVKVKFHWDRMQAKDEKSSGWIRVSQFWAGDGWGAMFLPRKGQEVIVSFLNGDPDRPIITGRVYNGANTPPHALPGHKTKSTILSQSTEGAIGSNELSFEDSSGSEEIYLHGQKDLTIRVKNNKDQRIGNDETIMVENNRMKTVASNETIEIGGVKKENVMKASTENVVLAKVLNVGLDYNVDVGAAHTVSVIGAMNTAVGLSQSEEVGLSKQIAVGENMTTNVGKNSTLDVSGENSVHIGKSYSIEVGESFEITCGQSSFKLKKDGTVTLKGTTFNFEASGGVRIVGESVDIN